MARVFHILAIASIVQVVSGEIEWNDLKITFPKYTGMPRTQDDAIKEGLVSISPDTDCTNGGQFYGYRYVDSIDPSVALLYDRNGFIAGIQTNYLKSEIVSTKNKYKFQAVTMFQSSVIFDQDHYTLTAYFVDPKTICTTGRTLKQFENEGTGTYLSFQNGPTPADLVKVPNKRQQAIEEGWTKNTCFIGMGYHNFYKSDEFEKSNCTEIRPFFLLFSDEYNGELHGFGFATEGFASSPHFEHPPSWALAHTLGDNVAQCVRDAADSPGYSTMHVYFLSFPSILHNTLCL